MNNLNNNLNYLAILNFSNSFSIIPKDFFNQPGFNRTYDHNNQLKSNNDLEAIAKWLEEFTYEADTHRSNEKEVLNLILWSVHIKNKVISDLDKDDFKEYFDFLLNIPSSWCMQKGKQRIGRNHPDWRPFLGSLSLTSLGKSISIIKSMMDDLIKFGYLKFNPIMNIKKYKKIKTNDNLLSQLHKQERVLNLIELEAIKNTLSCLPINFKNTRMIFMFTLMYLLGLRRSELANLKWKDIKSIDNNMILHVVQGKGNKDRTIYINQEMQLYINAYQQALANYNITYQDQDHILISFKTKQGLSVEQIYSDIKLIGKLAAAKFAINTQSYQKLMNLSPHDIRRTSGTHQNSAGVPMEHIQANFGHSRRETTENNYVLAVNDERSRTANLHNLGLKILVCENKDN